MQDLQHITVAHFGPHKLHASLLEGHFHRQIGHQGAHRAGHGFIPGQAVCDHQIQQLIAIEQATTGVHDLQAIGIAIERNAVIGPVVLDRLHQRLGVGRAHAFVDVQAVGRAADGHHFGTQLMEHLGRDLVGGPVGGVHHNLQALEGQVVGEGALAKFDVATCRIVQTPGFAQRGRIHPDRVLKQGRFHGLLPGVRQFLALGAEELDAVVRKGVVARTDHHPQRSALRAGQISDGRSGHRAQQDDVDPGRVEARLQGAFQHVPRNAGVFADQHRWVRLLRLQNTAHGMRQAQDEIGRDRALAHRAANAVCAEILTCHLNNPDFCNEWENFSRPDTLEN